MRNSGDEFASRSKKRQETWASTSSHKDEQMGQDAVSQSISQVSASMAETDALEDEWLSKKAENVPDQHTSALKAESSGPSMEAAEKVRLVDISASCSNHIHSMALPFLLQRSQSLPPQAANKSHIERPPLSKSARKWRPADGDISDNFRSLQLDDLSETLEQFYDALDSLDLEDDSAGSSPKPPGHHGKEDGSPSKHSTLKVPRRKHTPSQPDSPVSAGGAHHSAEQGRTLSNPGVNENLSSRWANLEAGIAAIRALSDLKEREATSRRSSEEPGQSGPSFDSQPGSSEGSASARSSSSLEEPEVRPAVSPRPQEGFAAVSRLEVNDLFYDAVDLPAQASPHRTLSSPLTEKNLWGGLGTSRESKLESIQRAVR